MSWKFLYIFLCAFAFSFLLYSFINDRNEWWKYEACGAPLQHVCRCWQSLRQSRPPIRLQCEFTVINNLYAANEMRIHDAATDEIDSQIGKMTHTQWMKKKSPPIQINREWAFPFHFFCAEFTFLQSVFVSHFCRKFILRAKCAHHQPFPSFCKLWRQQKSAYGPKGPSIQYFTPIWCPANENQIEKLWKRIRNYFSE